MGSEGSSASSSDVHGRYASDKGDCKCDLNDISESEITEVQYVEAMLVSGGVNFAKRAAWGLVFPFLHLGLSVFTTNETRLRNF